MATSLSTVYHLNRLAGTIINGVPQYDFDGAATRWGTVVLGAHNATRGIDVLNLIYAYRNGGKNYNEDTPGVLNLLAGTFGLGEAEAASRIVS
jgi:hypothetical protein